MIHISWINVILTHIHNKQEDPDGGWKNEQITTSLWDELIVELTGNCRVAAEVNIWLSLAIKSLHISGILCTHIKSISNQFFSIVFRNYCVRMPFQGVPSKMVARKCYHCAMKIVWPHISSSVTTIGFYWKRNVIVACHWRPEAIFDYPTANHCHDTITLLSIQHAPMLVLPKCIQKISHVS